MIERPGERPTSLPLFHFRPNEFETYYHTALQAAKFRHESSRAVSSLGSAVGRLYDCVDTTNNVRAEFKREYGNIASSVNVGIAYLKINQELSSFVPAQDIMSFFRSCVPAFLNVQDFVSGVIDTGKTDELRQRMLVGKKGSPKELINVILQNTPAVPDWFKGNYAEWALFFCNHSFFAHYLENDGMLNDGFIRADGIPDWFVDAKGEELPDPKVVEEEMNQDISVASQFEDHLSTLSLSRERVAEIIRDKTLKTLGHVNGQVRNLSERADSYPGLLLVLEGISNYFMDAISATRMVEQGFSERDMNRFGIESWVELFAQRIANHNILALERENVALFLEKRFSWADLLEGDNTTIIRPVIEEVLAEQDQPSARLEALRSDKRAFSVLNYELRPLLKLLSKDELAYLTELFGSDNSYKTSDIILEIAELVVANKNAISTGDKHLHRTLDDLRRFSANWFRNNWQWAVDEIKEMLKVLPQNEVPAETTHVEPLVSTEILFQQSQEINEEADKLEAGALDGWRLLYTERMISEEDALEDIGGETIAERMTKMEEFLRRNKISCSIGTNSVIDTFEWLVRVPNEVEWVRMGQEVNGEEWKKLKRGRVRFFYQMDKQTKQIVFFLHQKKAWSYNF